MSISSIYEGLKALFDSYKGAMTESQVEEESINIAVQIAVFYGDIKKVGETYYWVTK